MITLTQVYEELNALSKKMNDTFSIPVSINSRLTATLGRVKVVQKGTKFYPDSMEFSKKFLENSVIEDIKDIIAHEWAHYYLTKVSKESHGHDTEFKRICGMIGCKSDGVYAKVENIYEQQEQYKYTVYCPDCGKVVGQYSRMCATLKDLEHCHCALCNGKHLYYVQNW